MVENLSTPGDATVQGDLLGWTFFHPTVTVLSEIAVTMGNSQLL